MKAALLLVVVAIALAFGFVPKIQTAIHDSERAIAPEMIALINSQSVNWKAGTQKGTFLHGASFGQIKSFLGTKLGGPRLPEKTVESPSQVIPDTFDARTHWPQCATMTQIRDQSACGSCWAFGAAEAMSDRICIFLNKNLSVSSADLTFCCANCGDGCGGGFPASAWQYWVTKGVVTETCDPYPFPSCDHHLPNSQHPCPASEYPNQACPTECKDTENWATAKQFGARAYSVSGVAAIQKEIMQNGPVEAAFSVYADFLTYKSGVYKHVSGGFLGGHAVKFIGWGTENEENYWLVANSWNPNWGDKGYFKILRGANECGIEAEVNGGVPKGA